MKIIKFNILLLILLAMSGLVDSGHAGVITEAKVYKYFIVDIHVFSFDPESPVDSYQFHGGGSSGGGTVGLGYYSQSRHFRINVDLKDRFLVSVEIVPDKKDTLTKQETYELDFSDFRPKSLELVKNDNGRLCLLNLTPSVETIDNRPKRADDSTFQFSKWVMKGAMVIFNDSVYAGQIGCCGGPWAYVSYPGYARVEFSLVPFKNAKPIGILKDGRVQIRSEDGQTLDIYGVKNGVHEMELPGGPYEVWARWENLPAAEPVEIPSKEEWIRMVKAKCAELGNTPPSDEELDAFYARVKNVKHIALSSGVGPIRSADKIEE